jgi:hypothetical protein
MPGKTRPLTLLLPVLVTLAGNITLGTGEASAQGTTAWKIATERDQMSDRLVRFAVTLPKSAPVLDGKSVTTALIIRCGSAFTNGPTHPELMILFTSLTETRMRTVATRYRFDDGPVRDYKLKITGRHGAHAILLPKFSDQDPIADLMGAKRLRLEVNLRNAENTLLDFNVTGAADFVRAIACQ